MIIGVYDSGLGGLSVWRELRRRIGAHLIYFGDTAHLPYGDKSPEQLEEYFRASLAFFQSRGCHAVVVACNTTSSVVLPRLRHELPLPVVGMIEGAVQAAAAVSRGCLGVLATRATAASGIYQQALQEGLPGTKVLMQAAPEMVPLVEAGQVAGAGVKQVLARYLEPLLDGGIDSVLLGCTHYSFLLEPIKELVGAGVQVIDPAPAVAHKVEASWAVPSLQDGTTEFWVSAQPQKFKATAERILGELLPTVKLAKLRGEDR